jgi:hypothetical protein
MARASPISVRITIGERQMIKIQSFVLAAVLGLTLAGCVETETELGSEEAELSCVDASCDGLPAYSTTCVFDAYIVADGQVFQGATQIGGLALFYSPSCHAVFTSSGFYQPQNHRTCAVRRNNLDNQQICADYYGSLGNVSPLRYLAVGKTAFGRTHLLANPNVAGRTGDFTRSY